MVEEHKNPPFLAGDVGLLDFLVTVEAIASTDLKTVETRARIPDSAPLQSALGAQPPLSFLSVESLKGSLQVHLLSTKVLDFREAVHQCARFGM